MSWHDRLLPASFRGVPFVMDGHQHESGRRIHRHQFPGVDNPKHQDFGRQIRSYRIEAYILGDDYDLQRDRLLEALEKGGRGLLVHPYLGGRDVVVISFRLSESRTEGRIARFSIEFEEAKTPARPTKPKGLLAVQDASGSASDAAEASMGAARTKGPQGLRDALSRGISAVRRTIQRLDVFGGPETDVAILEGQLRALTDDVGDLILAPLELANQVRRTIDAIAHAAETPGQALDAYRDLAGLTLEGGLSAAERANEALFQAMSRTVAISGWGSTLARFDWETREDAIRRRGEFGAAVDAELFAASDEMFAALQALRSAVWDSVPPAGSDLPSLVEVVSDGTTNTLTVAYELYDDADRADEVLGRNPQLWYPGAIPGGERLEVLNR